MSSHNEDKNILDMFGDAVIANWAAASLESSSQTIAESSGPARSVDNGLQHDMNMAGHLPSVVARGEHGHNLQLQQQQASIVPSPNNKNTSLGGHHRSTSLSQNPDLPSANLRNTNSSTYGDQNTSARAAGAYNNQSHAGSPVYPPHFPRTRQQTQESNSTHKPDLNRTIASSEPGSFIHSSGNTFVPATSDRSTNPYIARYGQAQNGNARISAFNNDRTPLPSNKDPNNFSRNNRSFRHTLSGNTAFTTKLGVDNGEPDSENSGSEFGLDTEDAYSESFDDKDEFSSSTRLVNNKSSSNKVAAADGHSFRSRSKKQQRPKQSSVEHNLLRKDSATAQNRSLGSDRRQRSMQRPTGGILSKNGAPDPADASRSSKKNVSKLPVPSISSNSTPEPITVILPVSHNLQSLSKQERKWFLEYHNQQSEIIDRLDESMEKLAQTQATIALNEVRIRALSRELRDRVDDDDELESDSSTTAHSTPALLIPAPAISGPSTSTSALPNPPPPASSKEPALNVERDMFGVEPNPDDEDKEEEESGRKVAADPGNGDDEDNSDSETEQYRGYSLPRVPGGLRNHQRNETLRFLNQQKLVDYIFQEGMRQRQIKRNEALITWCGRELELRELRSLERARREASRKRKADDEKGVVKDRVVLEPSAFTAVSTEQQSIQDEQASSQPQVEQGHEPLQKKRRYKKVQS